MRNLIKSEIFTLTVILIISLSACKDSKGDENVPPVTSPHSKYVSTQTEFNAALNSAKPGDTITLANGNYIGSSNWTKSGSPSSPILIRAENLLEARITGNFNPNGSDLIFYGLDFVNATMQIGQNVQSNRIKIWKCRWRDRPAPSTDMALRTYKTDSIDIAYCEWVNWAGRGISFGIAAGTRNAMVRYCLFRDAPDQRASNGAQYNATEAIQVGFGNADAPIHSGVRIEYCRFFKWDSDDEIISVKTSNVLIKNNSFELSTSPSNRLGNNNRWEANEIRNNRGIGNRDGPNLWLGNKHVVNTEGGWFQEWTINAGTKPAGVYDLDNITQASLRNASEGSVFAGNKVTAELRVGRNVNWTVSDTYPVKDTRIRQHDGPVTLIPGWHINTDSQPLINETLYTWAETVWLTNSDVGPFVETNLVF